MAGKREKSEQTMAAILGAAMELTAKHGLHNLSLGEIAKVLDISKSGVFVRVGSLEALQMLVVEECERLFREAVAEPAVGESPGLPQLDLIVRLWITRGGRIEALTGAHYATQVGETTPLNRRLQEGLVDWRNQLQALVAHAISLGQLRRDTDAAQLVFEIFGLILGFFYDARNGGVYEACEQRAFAAYQRLMSTYRTFSA